MFVRLDGVEKMNIVTDNSKVIYELQNKLDESNNRIFELESYTSDLLKVLKEADYYLDTNELTSINHGSLFHQDFKLMVIRKPKISLNKIKADAIREAVESTAYLGESFLVCNALDLNIYADDMDNTN